MYICVTNVDAHTKTPCTVEPMRTGPSFPNIKGFVFDWSDESTWPIALDMGVHTRAPLYYGTCDDDADTSLPGVIEVLTESEYTTRKHDEFYARKPYDSWIWDEATLTWNSPVPYPEDGKYYQWNEEMENWIELT